MNLSQYHGDIERAVKCSLSEDQIQALGAALDQAELQAYMVVVMAGRDFRAGRPLSAIARLRVDAAKMRVASPAIYDVLAAAGRVTG